MGEMPSAEQMLQDAAWLKRLATTLANDEDDADDLVQESWIAVWRRKPDTNRPLRPWLGKVARDLAGMKRRSDRRRAAREAVADDAQPPAAPDQLLEQMRLHRVLVDLVLELDEPYRSTVIARFVEGRTSASIALSLGIPAGTVRKRLREALSRLRAGLDANSGDRKRWAPAVLAFAKGGMQVAKPTKFVLVVLAALLCISTVTLVIVARSRSTSSTRSDRGVLAATSKSAGPRVVRGDAMAAQVVVAVTDAAGPVADAVVRCAPAQGELVVVRTARDGTASVDLAAGEWSIAASADGREPCAATLAVVAGRDAHVALVLPAGGRTLTGTVTDAGGGAIAGARIDAARLGADTEPARAVAVGFTDGRGRYRLSVGGGQILVAASHPEYAPQRRFVDLGASGATADFSLVPGGVIEGVVRDQQTKQPVVGAAVRASHDFATLELAESNERSVMSDGDGKFRLAGLRPGVYQLVAREGGRSTPTPVRVGLGVAERQTNIVLLVAATRRIRGKVVDETGATAAGVTVSALDQNFEKGDTTSDDAGAFILEGLVASRWMLHGASDRYIQEGHTIVELDANDVDGIVVHVRRGLEIKGHVEPREICDVVLAKPDACDPFSGPCDASVTTTQNGEFRFGPLAPGTGTVAARCANGDEGTVEVMVAVNAPERILPVKPGASIAGRVVDSFGNPIAGVTVAAEHIGDHHVVAIVNGVLTSGFKAITSTGGAFEIRGLDAANYLLVVFDRGRPMRTKKGTKLALAAAQHASGVEIIVERPAGTIRGTVTGPGGEALGDTWVALHQTPEDVFHDMDPSGEDTRGWLFRFDGAIADELPPALSDATGHFELTNVPHGKYQVTAEGQSGRLRGRAAGVTPDAEIAIQLLAVGTLRGTVHGPHGPSELFSVELAGRTPDRSSFAHGAFEFPRVDPGDYTLDVRSSDGTGRATAHVSAGEVASVDVALVANATVTGRVVDKSGKPLSGVTVVVVSDPLAIDLRGFPPSSGPDGRFRVQGRPGKMTLVVVGDRPTLKQGLLLESGNTIDVGDVTVEIPR